MSNHKFIGYPYYWGLINDVYRNFLNDTKEANTKCKISLKSLINLVFIELSWLLFSSFTNIINLTFALIQRKPAVVVWTGDYYTRENAGDFRLGNFYKDCKKENLFVIDFINKSESIFKRFSNFYFRKRTVIYYNAIQFYIYSIILLFRKTKIKPFETQLDFFRIDCTISRLYLKMVNAKVLIAWEFSKRQCGLIGAAKSLNIPVVGTMHGAGMRTYMVHEFIKQPKGEIKVGPDIMGVWSDFWLDYYLKNSNCYSKLEVCCYQRAPSIVKRKKPRGSTFKILWISEPLAILEELYPYFKIINENFDLSIKIRPNIVCSFYNSLTSLYPQATDLHTETGSMEESVIDYDLVVGSHSTAVIESSLYNIPFLLVETNKWGNYFDLNKEERSVFFVEDCAVLNERIKYIQSNDVSIKLNEVKCKFFGSNNISRQNWLTMKSIEILKN